MKKRKLKIKNILLLFTIIIILTFLILVIFNRNNNKLESIGYSNLEIKELEKLSDKSLI